MTTLAIVFPGQGSQSVGMLSELATRYPVIKKTFSQASSVLDYDLWKLVQQGPLKELNKTHKTQPAILTASIALWRVWRQNYPKKSASILAGHSLGEYSALVCSKVIDFSVAIKLVELRARLMQDAVPINTGSMLAIIGLDDEVVINICEKSAKGQVVSPASFNSPKQIVVSGHKEAVERAGIACKKAGAKYILPISISIPSHCDLMKPAAEKLALILKDITFCKPTIMIINSVDVRIETSPDSIRKALVRQLYSPVRWTETVKYLANYNIHQLLEIGPGKVLIGLTKRIRNTLSGTSLKNLVSLAEIIQ